MNGPTAEEIRAWPVTVDLATAAQAFGISRSYAYELARRNEFPAKVLQVGGKRRVVTASILATLTFPQSKAAGSAATDPAA